MTRILLVGNDLPLLEGLAQSLASSGFTPVVAQTLTEARELAVHDAPLVAIVSRALAATASADTLSIPVAPGGALMLYRAVGSPLVTFSPSIQRVVLADLTLPLERNRLIALLHHVDERAKVTGRGTEGGPTREIAPP
jgi:hypothetical protein